MEDLEGKKNKAYGGCDWIFFGSEEGKASWKIT
jgi:hypothetical protein